MDLGRGEALEEKTSASAEPEARQTHLSGQYSAGEEKRQRVARAQTLLFLKRFTDEGRCSLSPDSSWGFQTS